MKRLLFILVLLFTLPAMAGSFTVTTTAQEDAALQFALDAHNAQRAAQTPPLAPRTAAQYVDFLIRQSAIASYQAQKDAADGDAVKAAYIAANNAKQTQVKTALGLP